MNRERGGAFASLPAGRFARFRLSFFSPFPSNFQARESDGKPTVVAATWLFKRIRFDHCTASVIPWTRMHGSSNYPLISCRFSRTGPRWVMAVVLLLVSVAAPLFAGGLSLAQKHEHRHEIDQLEDEWRNAILNGDTKTMDSLMAEDYMAVTPSGTLQSRDETLQNLKSGRTHFTSLTVTDRKVRFYGSTALVTSLANVQATTPDGPLTGSYRYTRVYVRNAQGVWKIVSFEASRVRLHHSHHRMKNQ